MPSRGRLTPRHPSTMSILVSQVRLLTRLVVEVIYFLSSSCMCSCTEQLIITLFMRLKFLRQSRVKTRSVYYASIWAYSATAHVCSCLLTCTRPFPVIDSQWTSVRFEITSHRRGKDSRRYPEKPLISYATPLSSILTLPCGEITHLIVKRGAQF